MGTWLAAIVAVLTVTGCKYGPDAFRCSDNTSCGTSGSRCEPDGFCSFPDLRCDSGQRYGDLSGSGAGECVPIVVTIPPDGPPDMAPPPDGRACFGSGIVVVCLAVTPTTPLTISAPETIDTATSPRCVATVSGGDNYCVVAATTINVNATLKATGAKPLVLLASDTLTVTELIDVGSHRPAPEFVGAGADPAAPLCTAGNAPGARAGGAGGSFTGTGGKGGDAAGAGGGNGGTAPNGSTTVNALRGGCPGQPGNGGLRGLAGHGGGAVYLLAGTRIDITGPGINAGGEGGAPGTQNGGASSGAGGGGSGGMIGLEAPAITCASPLVANGGAGGEGSSEELNGNPGADALTPSAAFGGFNGSIGGDGGNGSSGAAAGVGAEGKNGASAAGNNDGAGGGGGGGAGLIKGPAGMLGGMVSPAAVP